MTSPSGGRIDRWFAWGALGAAGVGLAVVLVIATTGGGTNTPAASPGAATPIVLDDGATAQPGANPADVVAGAAAAMAAVTSVEFELHRGGAPVFIDEFEAIALDSLVGQFTVPGKAAAAIDVTVEGDVRTQIGAVALDDEIWMSNPVTGKFETLPAGYDIDPSRFFDPTGGWQPLLEHLTDVELVGIDDIGGERYHIRATAPAAEVATITVGLVRNQDVPIELWVHPTNSLVTRAELTTVIDGAESTWRLDLRRYGEQFDITPPDARD